MLFGASRYLVDIYYHTRGVSRHLEIFFTLQEKKTRTTRSIKACRDELCIHIEGHIASLSDLASFFIVTAHILISA